MRVVLRTLNMRQATLSRSGGSRMNVVQGGEVDALRWFAVALSIRVLFCFMIECLKMFCR